MESYDARTLGAHEDVLQAEGFVALQLGCDLDLAAEVLLSYARTRNRDLARVAHDVLEGRLRFGSGAD